MHDYLRNHPTILLTLEDYVLAVEPEALRGLEMGPRRMMIEQAENKAQTIAKCFGVEQESNALPAYIWSLALDDDTQNR